MILVGLNDLPPRENVQPDTPPNDELLRRVERDDYEPIELRRLRPPRHGGDRGQFEVLQGRDVLAARRVVYDWAIQMQDERQSRRLYHIKAVVMKGG